MSDQAIYPFFFKLSKFNESRNTAFLGGSEPFYVDALYLFSRSSFSV